MPRHDLKPNLEKLEPRHLLATALGDVTGDGRFDSGDLMAVFSHGEYEDDILCNSTPREGDWNGDLIFSSSDLVTAFTDGGYESGPRAAVAAVPEPSSLVLLLIGLGLAHLAGLTWPEAKTISIETGIQNSTLGITLAGLITGVTEGFSTLALPSAVYGITMYAVALPFLWWFRSRP